MKYSFRFAALIMLLIVLVVSAPLAAQTTAYFPTAGWRVSTPEEQGMDSDKLAAVLDYFNNQPDGPNVHNVLVIRNGYVVLDASVAPFSTDTPHTLYSVTKAVVSTLAGVAQQQGYIQSPTQSIWDFFDTTQYANMDDAKQAMTLADLMTQRSGLGLNAGIGVPISQADDIKMYEMIESGADWLKFILDFPMKAQPGTKFQYNDSNPYVVTALIHEATGQPVEQFAEEALFAPLGITEYQWAISPQGIAWGGDGLLLSAYDLAKIGLLYLNNGQWDGQQIISSDWINAAWTGYFKPHYLDGYGFYWYVDEHAANKTIGYAAIGAAGQFLWVYPEYDLIVVTMGDSTYSTKMLCDSYILGSIQSAVALEPNPEGTAHLESALAAFRHAEPVAVPTLPTLANAIDSNTYIVPENSWGLEQITLDFGTDEALLTLVMHGETLTLPVGLDDMYHVSEEGWQTDPVWQYLPNVPLAARGWWRRDKEFQVRIRSTYGLQEIDLVWTRIAEDGTTLRLSANDILVGDLFFPKTFLELTLQ